MTFAVPDIDVYTGLIKDAEALKESVTECFKVIFGADFVSEEKLAKKPPYSFFYAFPGGKIEFYCGFSGFKTMYEELLALYSHAEQSVMLPTKQALKEKASDYNAYMTACLYISFVDREIIYSDYKDSETPNPDMWWVERMTLDSIPVHTTMLAATLNTDHLNDENYEEFCMNLQTLPIEWLHELYAADVEKRETAS